MKLIVKIFAFSILVLSNYSCSDYVELSSEEAFSILQDNFEQPCAKKLLLSFNSVDPNYDTYISNASLAQDEGIVKITERFISGIGGGGRYEISVEPTQEMKAEFLIGGNLYRVADGYIVEILGISQDKKSKKATVRFSYKYQPNQIYAMRGKIQGKREECSTETFEEEAAFTLFDTGWMLDK